MTTAQTPPEGGHTLNRLWAPEDVPLILWVERGLLCRPLQLNLSSNSPGGLERASWRFQQQPLESPPYGYPGPSPDDTQPPRCVPQSSFV